MKTIRQFYLLSLVVIYLTLYGCDSINQDVPPAGYKSTKENIQATAIVKHSQTGDISYRTADFDFYRLDGGHSFNLEDNGLNMRYGSDRIDARKMYCKTHRVVEYRAYSFGGNFGKENIAEFGNYLVVVQLPYYDSQGVKTKIYTFTAKHEKGKYLVANIYFDEIKRRVQQHLKETNITSNNL